MTKRKQTPEEKPDNEVHRSATALFVAADELGQALHAHGYPLITFTSCTRDGFLLSHQITVEYTFRRPRRHAKKTGK